MLEWAAEVHVRIIAVPPGEAPLPVREAWVGLLLPLVPGDEGPVRLWGQGVLSGPKKPAGRWGRWWRRLTGQVRAQRGYRVFVLTALERLEQKSPEAARWWRTSTPHLVAPGQVFIFSAQVGELTGEGRASARGPTVLQR